MDSLTGTIVTGMGKGKEYIPQYQIYFKEKIGFSPFPGTLNLEIVEDEAQKFFEGKIPLEIAAFSQGESMYGAVQCYPVLINKKIEGAIIVPALTSHPKTILELIAPVHLINELHLQEGDEVTCQIR